MANIANQFGSSPLHSLNCLLVIPNILEYSRVVSGIVDKIVWHAACNKNTLIFTSPPNLQGLLLSS